ncbi:hypothetical protein ACLOJK_033312 [Asimina triloba]
MGCALSLLSSKSSSWVPSADLSSRSSAALRELIAENRAAVLARQLMSDRGWNHGVDDAGGAQALMSTTSHNHHVAPSGSEECRLVPVLDHFHEPAAHVTLDLMQRPNASFQILSNRTKSKEEEEGCCDIWRSLEGTHVYEGLFIAYDNGSRQAPDVRSVPGTNLQFILTVGYP